MHSQVLLFLNIGTPELILILFAALLLFGGNKLPELARGLGKGIREFKDASEGVKREIHRNINAVNDGVSGINFDDSTNNSHSTNTTTSSAEHVAPAEDNAATPNNTQN